MKSEGKNVGGRELLTRNLMKRGMSRRDAVRTINFIFKELKRALARNEEVEFAGGRLVRVRKSFGKSWDEDDDWPAHLQGHTVEWQLSPAGQELLCGPLDEEELAYLEAIRETPAAKKRERRGRKKRANNLVSK
jgi:hypothetical protein